MVPGWASWAQLVPSWRDLGSKLGSFGGNGFGEHFGGTFGHRRECKIRQHYNVFGNIFCILGGLGGDVFQGCAEMAPRGVQNPRFSAKSEILAAMLAPRGVQKKFQDASRVEVHGKPYSEL